MPGTVTSCPLCKSSRSRLFDRREFRGVAVSNQLCRNCGLVYQSPRMDAAEAAAYYEAEYRRDYQGEEGPIRKDLAVQRARAESLLAFTRRHAPLVTRHLDIGCSAGLLLQRFQAGFGCQPFGVEPGQAYRQYAARQGLPVYASLEELRQAEETPFDLISMAHVLEHLPNPLDYLAGLRRNWLSSAGWLLLEVPNLYAHDSFEPAHMVAYSAQTLRQIVQQAGYEVIALKKHGQPRSKLIPFYLTLLARPSQEAPPGAPVPERLASLKRRLGVFNRQILLKFFTPWAWNEIS
jgi:2-polyprenyl-3-methyl-5-hydroxy-6-metoxy-1,4-benzoquinol methylase